MFFWTLSSAANTDAVLPDGIKTPSAIGWSTFFITYNPVFNKRPRSLLRNFSDCTIWDR